MRQEPPAQVAVLPGRVAVRRSSTPVHDSPHYNELLSVLRLSATLLPFALIPLGLLNRVGLYDSRFYAGDGWFALIMSVFIVVALTQFYTLRERASARMLIIYAVLYHIMAAIYLLFVTGLLAPPIILWIVMTLRIGIYFGPPAFWSSMAALAVTVVADFSIYPFLTSRERWLTTITAILVATTGYVIMRLHIINNRERQALLRTRQQESFQRERLLALINSMGDAVVTTNEHGRIMVYNAAFSGLLDTNVDLTGKNIDRLLQLRDRAGTYVPIVPEAIDKRTVFSRTDLAHTFEDDESIRLYVNVAPIRPGFHSASEHGFIFLLRDITKEKTLEEERDEFVSVISHELRTPVAIAEGNLSNISLLQKRGVAQSVLNQAVVDAHDQILYLSKLINDLASLSRAERGLDNNPESIDLTELLAGIYKTYTPEAHAKGLHLNLDVDSSLPTVYLSKLYLKEILQNLVTNAIKYTHHGSITLIGHRQHGQVYVAVKDTGIGIGKSDQKHIFEKFYRSEDYRTRESNGTGLGLYISQKLAVKMGLTIDFESRLNHGSTFSLRITPDGSHQPSAPATAPSAAEKTPAQ